MSNDWKPYDRNGKLKLRQISEAQHKENLKNLKKILEIFKPRETRDYVDYIDNENPNDKGRD